MLSSAVKAVSVLLLLQSISVCALLHDITVEGGGDVHWDYSDGQYGPKNWHKLKPEWAICDTGCLQSPIEVSAIDLVSGSQLGDVELSDSSVGIPATIFHNGHTVQVDVPSSGNYANMTIKKFKSQYRLQQFHYHMPSEHRIMNQSFPLELHLVYTRTNASHGSMTAVVSFLFVEGVEINNFFAQFSDILPSYKKPNIKTSIGNITLPMMGKNYGRYLGSLTTPPCTQTVIWIINMWNFPTVSKCQLKKLKAALPGATNRPTFPSTGRNFRMWP